MRAFRVLLAQWVLGAVLIALALGLHFWAGFLDAGVRLPPFVEGAAWVFAGCAALAIVWSLVRAFVRVRPALERGARRLVVLAALGVAHASALLGIVVGAVASDPAFPFGTEYRGSVDSPHGGRIYLYTGGLFCTYELYERRSGGFFLRRLVRIHPDKCVAEPRVRWSPEHDAPVVVDRTGAPVVNGSALGRAFDWAPH